MRAFIGFAAAIFLAFTAEGQALRQTKGDFEDKFRQLDEDLPTPSDTRLASGAPGPNYWQQQVDYDIKIRLDERRRRLVGEETITYTNNSPHTLTYLWLQLDQNRFARGSLDNMSRTEAIDADPATPGEQDRLSYYAVRRAKAAEAFDGGYKISEVRGADGEALKHVVVDTNMRIDLPQPLPPGGQFEFSLDFEFNMIDANVLGGRGGYECFEDEGEDGNCIFQAAQWYPRLHAYTDYEGWHNKAFLGRGEFTVEFGDYRVEVTVPADHVVSGTGVLQNEGVVLSDPQQARLNQARDSDTPVFIVTKAEAERAEASPARAMKTWIFEAENVRDFAWASSRKFIWDAMMVSQEQSGGDPVLAMSFYPKEGEPLWSAYSTKSIAHTIDVYSRFAFTYPYPVSQSVNGPVGGMEYPMITFNGPRPQKDGEGNLTYSRNTKYGLITVIIHEIGHNYFPMIVNSDERQWTWMDEGLNTFLQYIAEKEWEDDYPSWRGEPEDIVPYMMSDTQVPIMTQSDSILQFGNNAYGKPATALNILRESIMGRELFDMAFREYAQRWMFKRPTPSDFFRTMEEASGVDLDWFWRGWFYSTDHVDIAIERVVEGTVDTKNPEVENPRKRQEEADKPESLTQERNAGLPKAVETDPSLLDFYNENDEFAYGDKDLKAYRDTIDALEPWEREALEIDDFLYIVTLSNKGGLVMPVILELTYESGETEIVRMPAEIWRRDPKRLKRLILSDQKIVSIELDPRRETADVDRSNNHYPQKIEPSRLEIYKEEQPPNLMERLERKVEPDSLETTSVATSNGDED